MMAANPLLAALATFAFAGALAAAPRAEPAGQERICRAPAKQLGSRIRTPRRCRTAEQWKAEQGERGGLPIGAQVTEGQNDGQAPRRPQ